MIVNFQTIFIPIIHVFIMNTLRRMCEFWHKTNIWKEDMDEEGRGGKKTAESISFHKSLNIFPPSHIYSLKNWKWCINLCPHRKGTSQKTESTLGRRRGKHGLSGSYHSVCQHHVSDRWFLKGYLQGTINQRIMRTTKGSVSQLLSILLATDPCGIYTMCMNSVLDHMFSINIW